MSDIWSSLVLLLDQVTRLQQRITTSTRNIITDRCKILIHRTAPDMVSIWVERRPPTWCLPEFDDLGYLMLAALTFERAAIIIRLVWLNPREPHSSAASWAQRSVKNNVGFGGCWLISHGCLPLPYRREHNRSLSHRRLTKRRCRRWQSLPAHERASGG